MAAVSVKKLFCMNKVVWVPMNRNMAISSRDWPPVMEMAKYWARPKFASCSRPCKPLELVELTKPEISSPGVGECITL